MQYTREPDGEQELTRYVDQLVEKEAVTGPFDAALPGDDPAQGIAEPVDEQGRVQHPEPRRVPYWQQAGDAGREAVPDSSRLGILHASPFARQAVAAASRCSALRPSKASEREAR